jgi:catechol 2,3-dioxygenase-like lactoylglutathione lyase family enzyme
MPLSHIGIPVSDIEASSRFYEAALAPLGLQLTKKFEPEETEGGGTAIGFGPDGTAGFFWIGDKDTVGTGLHIAFEAGNREQVDAFHAAAVAAGGLNNGEPGLRPDYGPDYYAAFVFDPDGVNVEAVCER